MDLGLERLFQVYMMAQDDIELEHMENVSEALKEAAVQIVSYCPSSADRTLAIQHLVDAQHRAHLAIIFKGERLIPMT